MKTAVLAVLCMLPVLSGCFIGDEGSSEEDPDLGLDPSRVTCEAHRLAPAWCDMLIPGDPSWFTFGTASGAVGPEGGVIEGEGIRLEIPAGALAGEVGIRIHRLLAEDSVQGTPPILVFEPEGLVFGAPVTLAYFVDPNASDPWSGVAALSWKSEHLLPAYMGGETEPTLGGEARLAFQVPGAPPGWVVTQMDHFSMMAARDLGPMIDATLEDSNPMGELQGAIEAEAAIAASFSDYLPGLLGSANTWLAAWSAVSDRVATFVGQGSLFYAGCITGEEWLTGEFPQSCCRAPFFSRIVDDGGSPIPLGLNTMADGRDALVCTRPTGSLRCDAEGGCSSCGGKDQVPCLAETASGDPYRWCYYGDAVPEGLSSSEWFQFARGLVVDTGDRILCTDVGGPDDLQFVWEGDGSTFGLELPTPSNPLEWVHGWTLSYANASPRRYGCYAGRVWQYTAVPAEAHVNTDDEGNFLFFSYGPNVDRTEIMTCYDVCTQCFCSDIPCVVDAPYGGVTLEEAKGFCDCDCPIC